MEGILAKDIDDCENCPLYQNDCPGGYVGGPGGVPIEPPCCSWNDDTLVYEGMFPDLRYSPLALKWMEEDFQRKESEKEIEKHRREIERLRDKYSRLTYHQYKHIEQRYEGELKYSWLCPYCHTWRLITMCSERGGFQEGWCSRCGKFMYYSRELELEDFPNR